VGRKTFRHKRGDILVNWRKSHSEGLHSIYFSLDIVRFIKSRQKRREEQAASIEGRETHEQFTGKPEGNRTLEHTGTEGRIMIILTLNPLTWRIWTAPNNASKWQMGFNLAFKGLKGILKK